MMLNPFAWDAPWFVVAAGLFVVVMARANATYWLGRLMATGTARSRHAGVLDSPGYARASRWLERWGAPVVTVSFLTVGVQTLVNLAAGVGRMPLRAYVPAVTVGCLVWALLYSTMGFVGYRSFVALHERSPWLAWSGASAVVLAFAVFVILRVRAAGRGRLG